jgi:hypothetical protein
MDYVIWLSLGLATFAALAAYLLRPPKESYPASAPWPAPPGEETVAGLARILPYFLYKC